MPAVVGQLLDALKSALNAPDAQAALGQAIPADRGYQETQDLKAQSVRLILTPGDWRVIGRCGGLTLTEQLVECRLLRKAEPVQANAAIDADVAAMEAVRTILQDFDHATGRVIDTTGPKVIEAEKLQHPGQVDIRLLLNCDILTGTAASDPTPPGSPDEVPKMIAAYDAVWQAIAHYPPLNPVTGSPVFARRYRTSADIAELQLRDPFVSELPAIAVYWGDVKPVWKVNTHQLWPMSLRIAVWTAGDRHAQIQSLCTQVFDALYRAVPEGTPTGRTRKTYMQDATGYTPERVGSMTISSVTLGRAQKVQALRADVAFTLRSFKDPFGGDQ